MNSLIQLSALLVVCYLCVFAHGVPVPLKDAVSGSSLDAAPAGPKDDLDAAGFWGWGHRGYGWGGYGGYGYGGYGYPYRGYYSGYGYPSYW